jgi:hypothetical protein
LNIGIKERKKTITPQCSNCRKEQKEKDLAALMYFAQQHEWHAVLSFHAFVLLEIERGLLSWGD